MNGLIGFAYKQWIGLKTHLIQKFSSAYFFQICDSWTPLNADTFLNKINSLISPVSLIFLLVLFPLSLKVFRNKKFWRFIHNLNNNYQNSSFVSDILKILLRNYQYGLHLNNYLFLSIGQQYQGLFSTRCIFSHFFLCLVHDISFLLDKKNFSQLKLLWLWGSITVCSVFRDIFTVFWLLFKKFYFFVLMFLMALPTGFIKCYWHFCCIYAPIS